MASAVEELLRAAAAQIGLTTPLGYWAQRVSAQIGQIFGASVRYFQERRSTNLLVAAGGVTNIFGGVGAALDLVATREHEQVYVYFRADRQNTAAAGTGGYQLRMDGVDKGGISSAAGTSRTNVVIVEIVDMETIGPHSFDIFVQATAGDETVLAPMVLGAIQNNG